VEALRFISQDQRNIMPLLTAFLSRMGCGAITAWQLSDFQTCSYSVDNALMGLL